MYRSIDIWQLLAGLGLFLFGLRQVEETLRELAGRTFKTFLRRHTERPLNSVASGILATALLQSSSVVSLMVLAFVAAGIITMRSALGVVFGANIGTTFTGWIVVILGFKLRFDELALPLIAIGALGMIALAGRGRLYEYCRLTAAAGLVFLGLGFMKVSVSELAQSFDLSAFVAYDPIVFFTVGLVFTAIIQSSSATLLITLSALNAGIIDLPSAAAIVIGANLGTTVTVVLGAIGGSPSQKRVAFAHVLFNIVTTVVAYIFMFPLLAAITNGLGISDPLIALVIFHSVFNVLGVLLFFPFLGKFADFLERHFMARRPTIARHVRPPSLAVPEAALVALDEEAHHLLQRVIALNLRAFDLPYERPVPRVHGYVPSYQAIKQLEEEILEFGLTLQQRELESVESEQLQQLLSAVRNAVHSAKCLKDVRHNLIELEQSPDSKVHGYYQTFRTVVDRFYSEMKAVLKLTEPDPILEGLERLTKMYRAEHTELHERIMAATTVAKLEPVGISTLFNINRELYSSNKMIIRAASELLLTPEKATEFADLPVA